MSALCTLRTSCRRVKLFVWNEQNQTTLRPVTPTNSSWYLPKIQPLCATAVDLLLFITLMLNIVSEPSNSNRWNQSLRNFWPQSLSLSPPFHIGSCVVLPYTSRHCTFKGHFTYKWICAKTACFRLKNCVFSLVIYFLDFVSNCTHVVGLVCKQ